MTACEAMTVAAAARNTIGSRAHPGTSRKNGLRMLLGSSRTKAPWPQVTKDAGGEDQDQPHSVIGARPKCPMSAYSASAPVTASTTAASEKNAIPK